MKLPNAEHAVVEIEKLRDYCLSPDHPKGKHKARVFLAALGISQNDADELRRVILNLVSTAEAIEEESIEYGRRFVVDFQISWGKESAARTALVRSCWIIRTEEDFPRLTSCYIL